MCNYELLAVDEGVSDNDVLEQARYAIAELGNLAEYPYLLLTSQGSFLDDEEVNPTLRAQVLEMFWRAGLRAVSTESEARYCLDPQRLAAIKEAFPGRFSIGIGLEAADDFIRNVVINKGLPEHMFVAAADLLKKSGFGFYTYISLGKPFLSADEDVRDAVQAIEMTLKNGGFMAVLEMINIQPHTLTQRLWEAGEYKPCNLRLGIDVLSAIDDQVRAAVSIKGFDADISPVPLALPSSCSQCDSRVRTALNEWNLNRDFDALVNAAGVCTCHPALHTSAPAVSVGHRVSETLRRLFPELS
jgi:archaeosine synthase beta-subunit